jgi:hypothetical protein
MEPPPRATSPAGTSKGADDLGLDAALLDDPRALQILSTEHWSLLSARALAYNEVFTRANMFLAFVSMSFVALALLAQATGFDGPFLGIAALVLGFDWVVGVLTGLRMMYAGLEDARATIGMNRIRNAYVRISPTVERFFISGVHDDAQGLMKTISLEGLGGAARFGLTVSTSGTMVGLIGAMVGGTWAATIALGLGADLAGGLAAGIAAAIASLILLALAAAWVFRRLPVLLESRFPTPPDAADPGAEAL